MNRFQYLTLGYALIFLTLGVYMFLLQRRIDRVRGELADLKDRTMGRRNS